LSCPEELGPAPDGVSVYDRFEQGITGSLRAVAPLRQALRAEARDYAVRDGARYSASRRNTTQWVPASARTAVSREGASPTNRRYTIQGIPTVCG
jgi:hypothetical protein